MEAAFQYQSKNFKIVNRGTSGFSIFELHNHVQRLIRDNKRISQGVLFIGVQFDRIVFSNLSKTNFWIYDLKSFLYHQQSESETPVQSLCFEDAKFGEHRWLEFIHGYGLVLIQGRDRKVFVYDDGFYIEPTSYLSVQNLKEEKVERVVVDFPLFGMQRKVTFVNYAKKRKTTVTVPDECTLPCTNAYIHKQTILFNYRQSTCGLNSRFIMKINVWKIIRLLWISFFKESDQYCLLSTLPKDIIREICTLIYFDPHEWTST